MRVMQMVDYYGTQGGLERFIYNISRNMLEQGDDTVIAVFDTEKEIDWGSSPVPVQVLNAEEDWVRFASEYHPDLIVWHVSPRTAALVHRLSAAYPTVASVHGPVCPSGTRLFRDHDQVCSKPGGLGCLTSWYLRKCGTNTDPRVALKGLNQYRNMTRALRACDRVYVVSDSLKEFLVIDGVEESKIKVFDNTLGAIYEDFPPPSSVPSQGELRLLFVGRLVYNKGAQYMLRAMKALLDQGIQVRGTVVGDGWYSDQLVRLARELGMEGQVTFTGKVSGKDIAGWYELSDVLVVPSIWPEPAGLVVPEARKQGKPVVVFDVGGLPEWNNWMDGVYVARPADVEHLAEQILAAWRGERDSYPNPPFQLKRIDIVEDLHSMA